ncbi:MAG TPA: copper resistance protein CopC [Gemmatimonadaceae bacterium]
MPAAARAFARAILPVAALLLFTPRPALAHLHLRHAEPAADATLTTVPREIRLAFTEPVQLAISAVTLTGPDGAPVALGTLAVDPASSRTLVATIGGALRAGRYTVTWRTASPDGHPVRGHYSFVIAEGAAGLAVTAPSPPASVSTDSGAGARSPTAAGESAAAPAPATQAAGDSAATAVFDVDSPLYAAVRWLGYAVLITLAGTVVFTRLVVPRAAALGLDDPLLVDRAASRAARVGWIAGWLLVVDVVLRLLAQAYAVSGGAAPGGGAVAALITGTVWGWGWMLEAAAALLAVFALGRARRGHAGGWGAAGIAVLALALSLALSGHAVASPHFPALLVLADAVHVLAASGWLGTLLAVAVVGIPVALAAAEEERGRAVARLVNAFSPLALTCAALLALTGVIAGWVHLGTLGALGTSEYGRVLVIKLGVIALLAALGAVNWRVLRPALGDVAAARRLRRSATAELVMGAVVLAVTAVLVATPPPAENGAGGSGGAGGATAAAHADRR